MADITPELTPEEGTGDDATAAENGTDVAAEPDKDEAAAANAKDPRLYTSCWACGCRIILPAEVIPEGKTADDISFRCGACGAETVRHVRQTAGSEKRSRCGALRSFSRNATHSFIRVGGACLLVFVPSIVIGMYVGAILSFWSLPLSASAWTFQALLGLCFIGLTLWSYTLAVVTKAGSPVRGAAYGTQEAAANGRLENWSFCKKCVAPRPQRCHHCSVCRRCVHDMDHHCPYINNCVGYGNRRVFVQFTMFAAAACGYALLILLEALLLDDQQQFDLIRGMAIVFLTIPGSRKLLKYMGPKEKRAFYHSMVGLRAGPLGVFQDMSLFLYFMVAVLVTCLVGALFLSQLDLLCRDTTQLEHCVNRTRRPGLREGWCNIRRTMGPVYSWLLPQRLPFPEDMGGRPAPVLLLDNGENEKPPDVPSDKKEQ
mmetsp:Transcript_17906/g.32499  ORF Transcript_17906/g.32499 Transcript_17906/m.32499 type:complete len:429 (+) Transcript_17906:97-1383(+)